MKMKPATAKGRVPQGHRALSATMGPGIKLDTSEMAAKYK
jgi:ribosomal protein L1